MTENEAIEILKENQLEHYHIDIDEYKETDITVRNMAIQALEEIQQYRAIGTVEDIQEVMALCKSLQETVCKYMDIGTIEEFKALKEHLQIIQEAYENTDGYRDGYAKAIDEFADKTIVMMPGHRQDIEQIAEQMKGDAK